MSDTDTEVRRDPVEVIRRDPVDHAADKKAELDKPAELEPAKTFAPSGAPEQVTDFDHDHPAVDANPRANTTALQNRIDFNDPTKRSAEAVADNLKAQASA